MNRGSVILTAAFLGIISIFSFGVYSGIIEIKKPQNFLGLVGIGDSDGFKFVGRVNLQNSSSTENNNYLSGGDKREASAPVKTKKDKKLNQPIVKVISGSAVKSDNSISSSSAIAFAAMPTTSSLPLISSVIITTSTIENLAPVKIQEVQEKNPEKAQEQNLAQTPQIIQELVIEQPQTQNQTQDNTPQIQENISANILISEIMVGVDGNSSYEFIELFNPTANEVDLTGWSIKKKSSTGSESTLVSSSRFEGKIILPNKYFLLANEGGYNDQVSVDVFWPKSYTLAYNSNAIIIYNSNNELIEEVNWTEIYKGQSIERESFGSNQFKTQSNPNPQNTSTD